MSEVKQKSELKELSDYQIARELGYVDVEALQASANDDTILRDIRNIIELDRKLNRGVL